MEKVYNSLSSRSSILLPPKNINYDQYLFEIHIPKPGETSRLCRYQPHWSGRGDGGCYCDIPVGEIPS